MSEPIRYNITIFTRADYQIDFETTEDDDTPVSMEGWSAEAQLREFPEARDYIEFTAYADSTGFHMTMDKELTAKIPYTRGTYDLFIIDPDDTRSKLAYGKAIIIPEVTR